MRPLLERLKGFIGIKNGLGLEEVSVDISSLAGLIALIGPNGAGKTTFLDNMHPFRLMPSKVSSGNYTPGSCDLYNEVYCAAEKEFHFLQDGKTYKSVLFIDPVARKMEAYLDVLENDSWVPLNKSGRASTYDSLIETIMGSPRLYFNSIFRCQEAPRLNTYRKGVIKDILAELLLLSDIQDKGKAAKAVVDLLMKLIDLMKAQETVLDPEAGKVSDLMRQLLTAEGILKEANAELKKAEAAEAEAASTKSALELELAQFKAHEENRARTSERAGILDRQVVALCNKMEGLEDRHHDKYKAFLEKRLRIGKIISHADGIRAKVEEEKGVNNKLAGVESELKSVYARIDEAGRSVKEAASISSELNPLLVKQGQNKTVHQGKKATLKSEITRVEASVKRLGELPCGEDLQISCPAVKATVEDKNRLILARAELRELEKGTGEDPILASRISDLTAKKDELQRKSDVKADEKRKDELVAEQDKLKKELNEVARWTRLLPELESAEISLQELDLEQTAALLEHLSDLEATMAEEGAVAKERDGVKRSLDELDIILLSAKAAEAKKAEADAALTASKNAVESCRRAQLEATGMVASMKKSLEGARKAGEQLAGIRLRLAEAQAERSLWVILEKGFSNDGIIPLEIDDAGPYIGSLANQLLSTCFGSQFSVRIDTQDMKADGTQAESFDITVIDNETGLTSSLHDKSGGQKTWLEDAITKAIALFNAERSKRKYHTLFTDERDGALSQDVKRDFFLLKGEALKLGGFTSEFFISHTPSCQDLADHKIVFQHGVGIEVR